MSIFMSLRQEDYELEAILGYLVKPRLKNKIKKNANLNIED